MDLATSPRGSIASEVATSVTTNPTTLASTDTDGLPRVKFQTAKLLAQKIDQISRTLDDVLYVEDVSPKDFAVIQKFRESTNQQYRFRRYYPKSQLLIISIPSKYHECLSSFLYEAALHQFQTMGLRFNWNTTRTATFYEERGKTGAGEGDASGHPIQPPHDSTRAWPTLVIEAGYSQSLAKLQEDMRWWFEESDHQVKIVLLVKMYPGPLREIAIEHWREEPVQFPGAMTSTRAQQLTPTRDQAINIIKNSATAIDFDPLSYSVTRGALELRFSDLFLREPRQGEGNIVVGIETLRWFGAVLAQNNQRPA